MGYGLNIIPPLPPEATLRNWYNTDENYTKVILRCILETGWQWKGAPTHPVNLIH
jgi:hypothetical protein